MDKKDEKEKRNRNLILFGLLVIILFLIIYFKNKGGKLDSISFGEALKKSKIKKRASKYI